ADRCGRRDRPGDRPPSALVGEPEPLDGRPGTVPRSPVDEARAIGPGSARVPPWTDARARSGATIDGTLRTCGVTVRRAVGRRAGRVLQRIRSTNGGNS